MLFRIKFKTLVATMLSVISMKAYGYRQSTYPGSVFFQKKEIEQIRKAIESAKNGSPMVDLIKPKDEEMSLLQDIIDEEVVEEEKEKDVLINVKYIIYNSKRNWIVNISDERILHINWFKFKNRNYTIESVQRDKITIKLNKTKKVKRILNTYHKDINLQKTLQRRKDKIFIKDGDLYVSLNYGDCFSLERLTVKKSCKSFEEDI